MAEGGVDYSKSNTALMTDDIIALLDDLKQQIIDGDITVPDDTRRPGGRRVAMSEEREAGRESAPPFVVMEHITKRFPGVVANDDVSLELRAARSTR